MNMKIDNTYEEQDDQLFPRKVAIRLASNKNRNIRIQQNLTDQTSNVKNHNRTALERSVKYLLEGL